MTKHDLTEDQKKIMFTLMVTDHPYDLNKSEKFEKMLEDMGRFDHPTKGEAYAEVAEEILNQYEKINEPLKEY